MPWTRAQTDLETALDGLQVEITVEQFEARIHIHDVDPAEIQQRLHDMFRALSKAAAKCKYGGGCTAWLYFMPTIKRDGMPGSVPVRSLRTTDGLAFILREHHRDCPGLAQGRAKYAAPVGKADNPTGGQIAQQKQPEQPKQASLFDLGTTTGYGTD
jgi:hypothetical protein